MKVETFKCDVCGKVKGEANHWWKLAFMDEGRPHLVLLPMADKYEPTGSIHLCGESCVQRKVSEFMSGLPRIPEIRG